MPSPQLPMISLLDIEVSSSLLVIEVEPQQQQQQAASPWSHDSRAPPSPSFHTSEPSVCDAVLGFYEESAEQPAAPPPTPPALTAAQRAAQQALAALEAEEGDEVFALELTAALQFLSADEPPSSPNRRHRQVLAPLPPRMFAGSPARADDETPTSRSRALGPLSVCPPMSIDESFREDLPSPLHLSAVLSGSVSPAHRRGVGNDLLATHAPGVELSETGEDKACTQHDTTSDIPTACGLTCEPMPTGSAKTLDDAAPIAPPAAAAAGHAVLPAERCSEPSPPRVSKLDGLDGEGMLLTKGSSASLGSSFSLSRFLPAEVPTNSTAIDESTDASCGGVLSLDRFLPSEPVVETAVAAAAPLVRWRYEPFNGLGMGIRKLPSIDAEKAEGLVLNSGDCFDVDEEVHGDGITFLRLADGRGWVFDILPGKGVMCVRTTAGA